MTEVRKLSRRAFLRISGGASAALVLGVHLPGRARAASGATFAPNAWLAVDEAGAVTIWVIRSEMGQGVLTSLPMIVAEQLDADFARVRVEQAVTDPKYGRMSTGGSTSVRRSWEPLQKAGAAAREMLVAAAAARFGVAPAACVAREGDVLEIAGRRRIGYGELAVAAARLPVPPEPRLKPPADFRIIGRPVPRVDSAEKVSGKARFGIDVRVPGMLFAVVARCPVRGGRVTGYDADAARRVPGVHRVAAVPSGVAVVAESSWAAIRGREALRPTYDPGENARLDDAAIEAILSDPGAPLKAVRSDGDFARAYAGAARRLEATYDFPFLAHATMEPMNCTARVDASGAELWAPTQSPTWAQSEVAKALGLPEDRVRVHTTLLGGGFGRRAMPDVPVEAAHVARAAGVPVQVLYTREDDFVHDFFRPRSRNVLAAGLDRDGGLAAWRHTVRAPSIMAQVFGRSEGRPDVVEGAADVPYRAGAVLVDCHAPPIGVTIGWWRSVYSSQNACAEECFLDEVAALAGRDPAAYRLALLSGAPRLRGVVELAASKAGWGKPLPPGHGRGIACHASFGSFAAEVAEVSVEKGAVRVRRVVAAVDCGRVVNPDTVAAQVEGAIVYGLSAALRGRITIRGGAAVERNFGDYEPLRIEEMPAVEVHRVESAEAPTGIGEPGLPPIAPAVLNAVAAASGRRVRALPLGAVATADAPVKNP
ncbi:MAG TPA: molybdopterin cofactor-binding domain-containing protein [Anaeromyxobacteraceae bacterium]|nr:molybdopterin cofactor-binding domain-containing protein [Anaeromyxobacteraceae bacterium]